MNCVYVYMTINLHERSLRIQACLNANSGSLSNGKGVGVEAAPQSAEQSVSSKHKRKTGASLDEDIDIQRSSFHWVDVGSADVDFMTSCMYACCIHFNCPSSTLLVESTSVKVSEYINRKTSEGISLVSR